MGKKLYVGNMNFDMGSAELEQMFSAHGTVESAKIVNDRSTGRSKGFGFVEMSNNAEAQSAIDALDGKDCQGRALKVNQAKPRPDRASGGYGGGGRNRY